MTKIITDNNMIVDLKEWLRETEQMLIPDEYLICENLIRKYDKEIQKLGADIKKIAEEKGVWVDEQMEVEIDGDYENPYSFTIIMKVSHNGWKEWTKIEDQVWGLTWKLPNELSKKFHVRSW